MKPDASKHDPRPDYLRALIERAGLTQRAAAQQLGLGDRILRYYLAPKHAADRRIAPYVVQYALEQLAK
jgi:hypothetical protein